MYQDQKLFNYTINYKKCLNGNNITQQSDKLIRKNIPQMIYHKKFINSTNQYEKQQRQKMKKQWMEIKNKRDNNMREKRKQQKINDTTITINKGSNTNNSKTQRNFTNSAQQFQQYQHKMNQNSKREKITNLSRTQPTEFLSDRQMLRKQSQQKFINDQLHIDVSCSPINKNRKTICSQSKHLFLQHQNHQDKIGSIYKMKNTTKLNKSSMVQKIINLRQTFNPKHKSITQSSPISESIEKRIYCQINKQLSSSLHQQKTIQSLNFPLLNNDQNVKMTFNQLFQYEKKKMQTLKKLLSQTNVEETIECKINNSIQLKNKNSVLVKNEDSVKGLKINERQNDENNLLNLSESKRSYLLYPLKGKNHFKYLSNQSHRKRLSNHSSSNPQQTKPIESLMIRNESVTKIVKTEDQNQMKPETKRRKKQSITHVTTYNFDYIQKQHIQKPQIKQLRHKYLYSNQRKLSKEDAPQSYVSIVTIHGGQNYRTNKWKTKLNTESFVEDFLQIEKIPHFVNPNASKTSFKQVNQKCEKRKNYRTLEKQKQKSQNFDLMTFRNFQPWQNHRQKYDYEILDADICQFSG